MESKISQNTSPMLKSMNENPSASLHDFIYNFESFTNYSPNPKHPRRTNSQALFLKNSFLSLYALTLIAFFTTTIACFIDLTAYYMIISKKTLISSISNPYLGCLVWVTISIVFILFATSFGYFISPEADGSGIPEVKGILSGVEMPKHLSWKTLFSKVFGLICCAGALSVGKEGPHVHISTIVASKVLKLKVFSELNHHPGATARIMEGSVAAGVAAVMAAPLGAVFFSMELTATFYMVKNVIPALYCGMLSSFLLTWYRLLNLTEVVSQTHIPHQFNNWDLIAFAGIGVVTGVLGVIFTSFTKYLVMCRAGKKIPWLHKRFRYAVIVTTIYSLTTYLVPFMMLSAKQVFNQMLSTETLPESWSFFGPILSLLLFCLCKPLFTAASTSVQIPGGVILHSFHDKDLIKLHSVYNA